MHGRTLRPILSGALPPDHHRGHVRCEYYRALNPPVFLGFAGSFATMIRDRRQKLVARHTSAIAEMYLERDPGEFNVLRDSVEEELAQRWAKARSGVVLTRGPPEGK